MGPSTSGRESELKRNWTLHQDPEQRTEGVSRSQSHPRAHQSTGQSFACDDI